MTHRRELRWLIWLILVLGVAATLIVMSPSRTIYSCGPILEPDSHPTPNPSECA